MNNILTKIIKHGKFHVLAIVVMSVIAGTYFSPVFSGKVLKQGDIINYMGMSQEIEYHRDTYNEDPLWTNAMFSGMPTYQISVIYHSNLALKQVKNALSFWMPRPLDSMLIMMFGFYFLLIVLGYHPIIAAIGGLAFAFSTYFTVSLEAGHNSKIMAIAFAPFVVGAFVMIFRHTRFWLGIALFVLFMALEISANHLQITYYLMFLLAFLGAGFLVEAIKNKKIKTFSIRTGGAIAAFLIAILINIGPILNTYHYSKQTTRGGSLLTAKTDGDAAVKGKKKGGLDYDYIHQWSYGIGETFTFLIPNFKGGGTIGIGKNNADLVSKADRRFQQNIMNASQYWGNLPFTSGTIYFGCIIIFLALLSLFYSKDHMKWWLLGIIVFTIMLSWGKNFEPFTRFFVDYFPGYNKFRSVTMIHSITILATIWLGLMYLNQLVNTSKEELTKNLKYFYIVLGSLSGLLLLFYLLPEMFNKFISVREIEALNAAPKDQTAQYELFFAELAKVRMAIFKQDVIRTLIFIVLSAGLLFAFFKQKINQIVLLSLLFVLVGADLIPINLQYINTKKERGEYENWQAKYAKQYPHEPNGFDNAILQQELSQNPTLKADIDAKIAEINQEFKKDRDARKYMTNIHGWWQFRLLGANSNFRVLEQANPFNNARTSYFHKSIGGYHGAKLARYQDLISQHLTPGFETQNVLNMLNTKYILDNTGRMSINQNALGNAWLVSNIQEVKDADEEVAALKSFDPANTAVLTTDMLTGNQKKSYSNEGSIEMVAYRANEIKYKFTAPEEAFVVFSEVFYAENWVANIDGKEAPIKKANFILRALEVPAGSHEITFKYEDKIYNQLNNITGYVAYLFIGLILLVVLWEAKNWFQVNSAPLVVPKKKG
jgi:hypothetical protein